MRNILVHDYFGIDLEEVWTAVVRDLPPHGHPEGRDAPPESPPARRATDRTTPCHAGFAPREPGTGTPRESESPSPAPTRTGPRGTSGSPATSSFNRRAPSRMPAAFAASLAPAAVSLIRCLTTGKINGPGRDAEYTLTRYTACRYIDVDCDSGLFQRRRGDVLSTGPTRPGREMVWCGESRGPQARPAGLRSAAVGPRLSTGESPRTA